jgi:hypothetical protein
VRASELRERAQCEEWCAPTRLPLILPARAALYSPLGSRSSHTASGIFMYTSMKSPAASILLRTASRSARYGEMKLTSVITPVVAYSFETSPAPV